MIHGIRERVKADTVIKYGNRYLIHAVILVAAWGGMFRQSFNCDTLTHMLQPRENIDIMLQHGRYLTALQDFLLYLCGISTTDHTGITAAAEVLLLAGALCVIQDCFEKVTAIFEEQNRQEQSLYTGLTWTALHALMFTNVLFAESFMFGECALMFGMAYLLAAFGVYAFTRQRYLLAFLLFFLSTMEYQAAVIYGAILLSVWIFIRNGCRLDRRAVCQEILAGGMTIGSGLLNIWSLDLLAGLGVIREAGRSVSLGNIWEKMLLCLKDLGAILISSRGLLPGIGLPFWITMAALLMTVCLLKKEKGWKAVGYYVLLVCAMTGMVYILPMVQYDTRTYPRFIWIFYVVQSMLLLMAFWMFYQKYPENGSRRGLLGKMAFCYMSCGYLVLQILFCNIIVTNHMVSNTLDRTYASMIYQKITEYEEATGIQVTKLGVANDTDAPLAYENVYYKTDQINERALGMVTNTLMNVVSGRTFEKVRMDEAVFGEHFEGRDWEYFDASQQLVIVEDTAYWVVF